MSEVWDEMKQANPVMRTVSIGASAAVLVDRSDFRVALIISAPDGARLVIGWDNDVSTTRGINLPIGSPPLCLTLQDQGRLIRGPVWAVAPGGTVVVTYAEALHPCACLQ